MTAFLIAIAITVVLAIIYFAMDKKEPLTMAVISVIAAAFFIYAAISSEIYFMLIVPVGILIWGFAGVVSDFANRTKKDKKDNEENKDK